MPRRKDEAAEETVAVAERSAPRSKAVTAVFHPDGNLCVNLTAPSGREYHIEPRKPFEIAGEDVGWFFYGWDWQFRQRLTPVEDYVPPAGYFDGSPNEPPKAPGSGEYFDASPSGAPQAPGNGEYKDTTPGTLPVITPEDRETRDPAPVVEETEPVADETVADE